MRQKRILVASVAVVVAALAAVGVYAFTRPDASVPESERLQYQTVDDGRTPQPIATSDALTRYVESLRREGLVADKQMYLPDEIDWNRQRLVAVRFSALAARSFQGINREQYEGRDSYVIDLLDTPKGCSVSQVNSERVAFIKDTSQETSIPVIIRITANTATCPL